MMTMNERRSRADRANAEQDLRATSDSIRADARRLELIEDEKTRLAPEDGETDRLSAEAVEVADRIARQARAERQIAREIA
jgi:hypothetical protein